MYKILSNLCFAGAAIVAGVGLYLGFMAYLVVSFRPDGSMSDGLGRELMDAPWWARLIGEDPEWPGLAWFAVDFSVFWGGVFVIYLLTMIASRLGENQTRR